MVKITGRFQNIALHEYIVMPNHFHAILEIVGATLVVALTNNVALTGNVVPPGNEKGQPQGIAPAGKTIGDMVGAFESMTTVEYIRGVKNMGWASTRDAPTF